VKYKVFCILSGENLLLQFKWLLQLLHWNLKYIGVEDMLDYTVWQFYHHLRLASTQLNNRAIVDDQTRSDHEHLFFYFPFKST